MRRGCLSPRPVLQRLRRLAACRSHATSAAQFSRPLSSPLDHSSGDTSVVPPTLSRTALERQPLARDAPISDPDPEYNAAVGDLEDEVPEELRPFVHLCPDAPEKIPNYACPKCSKSFVSARSLEMHSRRHDAAGDENFVCFACVKVFPSEALKAQHERVHMRRSPHVCRVCFDEFTTKQSLHHHLYVEDLKHVSSRTRNLTANFEKHFLKPAKIVGNRVSHTTNYRSRSHMESTGAAFGGASGRMHDGALRLSHAPNAVYFLLPTQTDAFYPVSFHPFFAEPGERTTSLTINLREFTRTSRTDAGSDEPLYRLFFVSVSPTARFRHRKLSFRATVMLAQKSDWEWCEKHLTELDMFDNPLFSSSRVTDADGAPNEWHAASHFESEKEAGDLTVVLTVSSGLQLSHFADPLWMPSSKLALIDGFAYCYGCDKPFHGYHNLFRHYHGQYLKCPYEGCSYAGAVPSLLKRHVDYVHEGKRHKCDRCEKTYGDPTGLAVHVLSAHEHVKFECPKPYCDKIFGSKPALAYHTRVKHSRQGELRFPCGAPGCDKVYRSKQGARAHFAKQHST